MNPTSHATNLKCQSCVAKIKPHLDASDKIESWSVDTHAPEKWLSVQGSATREELNSMLAQAGFELLPTASVPTKALAAARKQRPSWFQTYRPLLLIVGFLIVVVAVIEINMQNWNGTRAMRHFMGGFFLAFSFFKMLNVRAFASAFQGYDLLAQRFRAYGLAYPFLEFALGLAYLLNWFPRATNALTAVVMLVGLIGVVQVLRKKKAIQCACLGTVFDLPMSVVTFVENGLMLIMATWMLLGF